MTPTNAMITYVSEKFGAGSNEAVEMRLMVRGYLLRRGVTYEDCKKDSCSGTGGHYRSWSFCSDAYRSCCCIQGESED